MTCVKVDKHIRKLDADLARFEADLKDKSLGKPKPDERPESGKKSSVYNYRDVISAMLSFGHRLCSPLFIVIVSYSHF